MSIVYKLLGIPTTLDEFIGKVKRKGHHQVSIFCKSYNDRDPYGSNYICYTEIRAGRMKLKLNEHAYMRWGNLHHAKIGVAKVEQTSLKEAVEAANKLNNLYLKVTIDGESLDKAKERIVQYDEKIKNLEREENEVS